MDSGRSLENMEAEEPKVATGDGNTVKEQVAALDSNEHDQPYKMTYWQIDTKYLEERDSYILEHELWTDCSFLVGKGKKRKEFKCHKLMLAKTSQFFEELLFKEGRQYKECFKIPLPYIDPSTFSQILQYIYFNPFSVVPEDLSDRKLSLLYQAAVKCRLPVRFIKRIRNRLLKDDFSRFKYDDKLKRKIYIPCYCEQLNDGGELDHSSRPLRIGLSWQSKIYTRRGRDWHLYKRSLWTDCMFLVGQEHTKMFRCHRLILAKHSVWFENLLYARTNWKNQIIRIPDVTPDAFLEIIRYCYRGYIEEEKSSKYWELIWAAEKFYFPENFKNHLYAHIYAFVWPKRVWRDFQLGKRQSRFMLSGAIMNLIQMKTSHCIKLDDFKMIDESTLLELLQCSSLNCTEVELFEACVTWGKYKVEKEGGSPDDPKAVKEALREVIPLIRFMSMTCHEMTITMARSKLFSKREYLRLLRAQLQPSRRLPAKFCTNRNMRMVHCPQSFHVYGTYPGNLFIHMTNMHDEISQSMRLEMKLSTFAIFFATERTIVSDDNTRLLQLGVILPTQTTINSPSDNDEIKWYEEDITVILIDSTKKILLSKVRYQGPARYNDTLDIEFPKPVLLHRKRHRTVTQVIMHTTGDYPYCDDHLGPLTQTPSKDWHGPFNKLWYSDVLHYEDSHKFIHYQAYERRNVNDLSPYWPREKRLLKESDYLRAVMMC